MQTSDYIRRHLVLGDRVVPESEILHADRHVVVLAEPGAGKTELLDSLSCDLGTKRQRASVLRSRDIPKNAATLIVDGFDEVAKLDLSAFDDLIGKIASAKPKRVIIASRSSEWDSSRYDRMIAELLGSEPITVRLRAFEDDEQERLFEGLYPDEDFETFKRAATEFGVHVLLGNPQMLQIVGLAYVANDRVFRSRAQIFSDAVEQMCREHNLDIPAKERLSSKRIAAIGGEIFAKLLLSGATGIAASEHAADSDFPFLGGLIDQAPATLRQAVDTKLFKPSDETGTHEPIHRIIAEFGAAKHLAERINDATDQVTLSRILAIIAPSGALRDDLRGLLAWLTTELGRDAQRACINVNPYAVLSNGDPSQLANASKIHLINQLAHLSVSDPYFRRADRWRKFNTKGFFTTEVVEAVRQLLCTAGGKNDLRDLLLEIVAHSGEETALEAELREILFAKKADFNTRLLAMNALAGIEERNRSDDVSALIDEGSYDALRLAAELVMDEAASFSDERLLQLMRAFIPLFKDDDMALEEPARSTYFISLFVSGLPALQVTCLLSELSGGLKCTCGKERSYECHCRVGISKLIGMLLDRYFEVAHGPQCPEQLWAWMKALNFRNVRSSRDSLSVRSLQDAHPLRRAIQLLAFESLSNDQEVWDALIKFRHGEMHSGLFLTGDDETWMLEHAAKIGRLEMFSAFYRTHNWYSKSDGPSEHRVLQKSFARSGAEFLRIAASKERRSRVAKLVTRERRYRFQTRWRKRQEKIERSNAKHFAEYQNLIAKGEHWGWLKDFAREYLQEEYHENGVLKYVRDPDFIERALRSSVEFLTQNVPTLEEIGESRAQGRGYDIPQVAYAALLAVFREQGSLDEIDRSVVAAAKTDINAHHSGLSDKERAAFHAEIDRRLFPAEQELRDYLGAYVEPQLASATITHTSASLLSHDKAFADVAEETALRWLRDFPQMPFSSAETLFDIASKYERYDELREIISQRCQEIRESWPYGPPEKKLQEAKDFWFLRSFAFGSAKFEWEILSHFPENIFALSHRYDSLRGSRDGEWPALNASQVYLVLDAFVDNWPAVHLPSSWGTGSPKGETAFRFLNGLIWRIPDDNPASQIEVLQKLLSDERFERWHDGCRHLLAEARRKNLLRQFAAPTPELVCQLLDSNRVATVEDLRALVVEELRIAERWFRHGETDPLDAFYVDGNHVDENTARNRIVDRLELRLRPLDVVLSIEGAMARRNRCDFTAVSSIGGRRTCLVVEVKGQWHRELFDAAATQLHERYAHHPDAAEQGIFLVLWFGPHVDVAGKTTSGIQTALELEVAIRDRLPASLSAAIDVIVLDLSR